MEMNAENERYEKENAWDEINTRESTRKGRM